MGLALAAGGCATGHANGRVPLSDLRGTAHVSTPAPVVLVMGPVMLLHANVDKKSGAHFMLVRNRDAARPNCDGGAPLAWDGESDLDVESDEAVCVAVAHDTGISWHARKMPEPTGLRASRR